MRQGNNCIFCNSTVEKDTLKYKDFCSSSCYHKYRYKNDSTYREKTKEHQRERSRNPETKAKIREYMKVYMKERREKDTEFKNRTNSHVNKSRKIHSLKSQSFENKNEKREE